MASQGGRRVRNIVRAVTLLVSRVHPNSLGSIADRFYLTGSPVREDRWTVSGPRPGPGAGTPKISIAFLMGFLPYRVGFSNMAVGSSTGTEEQGSAKSPT